MTEPTRKVDRRIARTRALLRDALMALIIEKGYDAVSIQDITDRADVARTTFYLHFKDKDELLFEGMRDLYQDLIDKLPPFTADYLVEQTESDVDCSDWEHVQQYADFYRAMLGSHGSMRFVNNVRHYLAAIFREQLLVPFVPKELHDGDTLDFIAQFLAGAEIGLISWWLESGMPYEPVQMATMQHSLCILGLRQVIERGQRLNQPIAMSADTTRR